MIRTYCPRCNAHTEHSVTQYKHGKRRTLAEGQRRYLRKLKGYGSSRKPRQKRFSKVTDVVTVVLTCRQCGYKLVKPVGRLTKLEIVG